MRSSLAQYTSAAGAKDLKAVLFNWAWYTGMLRLDYYPKYAKKVEAVTEAE
jgi:hypothetical protein